MTIFDRGHTIHSQFIRTARGAKVTLLRDHFKTVPNFEVVQIDDIATSDFSNALKGASAMSLDNITVCLTLAS